MHYYQHNIGDYRRDTSHLSLLEHGVYRQLLDTYYLSEQPIPEETEVVFRRLSARTDEEKRAVEMVLSEFFFRENGWHHKRCDGEIAQFQGKADRARNNGKLGGRPRKTKVVISGNPEQTEVKANSLTHKPINQEESIGKTRAANRRTKLPDEFYPDQTGIDKALGAGIPLSEEIERFKDFHRGKGNVMADWQAAWRTWVGNAVKFAKGSNHGSSRDEDRKRTIRNLTGYDADAIPSVSTRLS